MESPDEMAVRADALRQAGKMTDAEQIYHQILAANPAHARGLNGLGLVMAERNENDLAMQLIRAAIGVDASGVEYYNNLGVLLYKQGRYDDAILLYSEALDRNNRFSEAHNNMGAALGHIGRDEEAITHYKAAIKLDPNLSEAFNNLGLALRRLGRHKEALIQFRKGVKLARANAHIHWNYATELLLAGNFATGWKEADWRTASGLAPRPVFTAPLWKGEDIRGKTLLIHCEQGLGDNIQFVRLLPLLRKTGARVIFASQAGLYNLLKDTEGADQVYLETDPVPPHDVNASLLDLPLRLKLVESTIPARVPYLRADLDQVAQWRRRLADCRGLKVGIAWRGNPSHKNDKNRSMTARQFATLGTEGINFVNLQKDATGEELAALEAAMPGVLNAAPELGDFTATAALIACLDAVIAVDTSVCHLAGALGVKTFTLLPFAPDWRWMLERADTPWYPTMRLFRQNKAGDWDTVLQDVKAALKNT